MPEEVKVNYVDHISIAVKDLEAAEKDIVDAYGWEVAGRYRDVDEKIRVVYFQLGPTAVENMDDIDGTAEVAKFLEKSGEGIMVLSFHVDDCSKSLDILKKNQANVIDRKPRYAKDLDRFFAFVHPKVCHGVLTEVIEGKYP